MSDPFKQITHQPASVQLKREDRKHLDFRLHHTDTTTKIKLMKMQNSNQFLSERPFQEMHAFNEQAGIKRLLMYNKGTASIRNANLAVITGTAKM